MAETSILDKTFHFILTRMMETGQAPHYTEIAAELGVSVEEGRKAMQDLFKAGIPAGCIPGPISSFPSRRSTICPPPIV